MSIIILYGGKINPENSEKTAREIYNDFYKKNLSDKVVFCNVDSFGNIFNSKIKIDAHKLLLNAGSLIDTTEYHEKKQEHLDLARKLGVKVFFEKELDVNHTRKIFKQIEVPHPDYHLFKKEDSSLDTLKDKLYSLWRNMHMPVIIKPEMKAAPVLVTFNPQEAFDHIRYAHNKNSDVILDNFTSGKKYTIIAIKNYRGQSLYLTPIVETFKNITNKNVHAKYISASYLPESDKFYIYKNIRDLSEHFDFNLAKIDVSFQKNKNGESKLNILNLKIKPSYHAGNIIHGVFVDYGINMADIFI